MTAHGCATPSAGRPVGPAPGELRLIFRDQPLSLTEHIDQYGPLPAGQLGSAMLIAEIERSGLTGRGGGAFPAGRKIRAVAEASTRPRSIRAAGASAAKGSAAKGSAAKGSVIVANGTESEPASRKDYVLLSHAPHLALDGIAMCASAVGASRAYLCVGHDATAIAQSLSGAVADRARAGLDTVPVQVITTAGGYLAGQENALISALNGNAPLPTFVPPRPAERGAHRRPTLVLNVETLAHIALIARFGSDWFRTTGTPGAPGSALVTVTGAVERPGVREIPLGTPLGEVLQRSGLSQPVQAVLTGGYFGTWLPMPAGLAVPVSHEGMRAAGAALGPGVLAVLPESACGLAETARIASFLAAESAGQCGPCRNGLPALAEAWNWIAFGRPGPDIVGWVQQLTGLVTGRGACHLPDGTAGLIKSALSVFAADVRAHLTTGPCTRAGGPAILPVPARGTR
ncbi:MAG TPA: NADH-ubiquinone oxidoreductase-F iron-sulfur binding region domain-containing protein [Streptosporangiaceae bacterium]|nr:NADH-ubiquinone oxidoreductase-F iron-sulfur binding region domain-containing protein [Streptosporangiaceae bacterium]